MERQYEIGSSPDGTYVYARAFRVPYTAELAFTLAGEIILIGQERGAQACLIDLRGTRSVSSNTDKYNFAYEKAENAGIPHYWRFAFLKDPEDTSPGFIVTVMKNAGYLVQIFEDEGEAIEWLRNMSGSS